MSLDLYDASVPVLRHMLSNLDGILAKTEEHVAATRIDPSVFLQSRLYPDMFPLVRQVQVATDHAKGAAARLSGSEPPRYPDEESSFGEVRTRITKTLGYLDSIPRAAMEGAGLRRIAFKVGGTETEFESASYLLGFALPNFFFHVTTAYDILRHNGVPLGKRDYLGLR